MTITREYLTTKEKVDYLARRLGHLWQKSFESGMWPFTRTRVDEPEQKHACSWVYFYTELEDSQKETRVCEECKLIQVFERGLGWIEVRPTIEFVLRSGKESDGGGMSVVEVETPYEYYAEAALRMYCKDA